MKAFTALTIAASFFLGSQASPIEVEERGISAKVTLCSRPNLQDCDTTYIPIDTCCTLILHHTLPRQLLTITL